MGMVELSLSLTAEVGLCVYFAGLIRREKLSLVVPRGAREAGVHLSLQKEKPVWRQNQDKVRQPRFGESAVPRHHLDTLIQSPLKQDTSDFFQFAKLTHFFYFCLN